MKLNFNIFINYMNTDMSLILAGIVTLVMVIVGFFMGKKMMKSPRQKEIEKELGDILKIKMRHHDLIVKELENGADEERHTALLAEKEAEVLEAIDVAEKKLDIEINKENPTQVGPVKLIKDNKPKEDKA